MRAAPNSDTGAGSELLAAVHATHTGYNAPAVVCDIGTSRLQRSYWDTPKHHEGYLGDVDKASGWRNGRGKANAGGETADISEVVLIVDSNAVLYSLISAGIPGRVLAHHVLPLGTVTMMIAVALIKDPRYAPCFLSLTLFHPLSVRTLWEDPVLISLQTFPLWIFGRHAVFLRARSIGIVCWARWEAGAWKERRELTSWDRTCP